MLKSGCSSKPTYSYAIGTAPQSDFSIDFTEVIYDDPYAFSLAYRDGYFIYGQSFSGRDLLVLVRILSPEETTILNFESGANVLKIITARDMNLKQRRMYALRKGF
jgi:hypothetical protein